MDRYTKGFVVAALGYFFLAAVLGIWMGAAETASWTRFAHVHFNLLGFMAMMIYGVGYFILPRFNGRILRWPSWVPVHFYLANIGLIGMVATSPERPSTGFTLFAVLSVVSVALFAVNLGATMLLAPAASEEAEEDEESPPEAARQEPPAASPVDIHPDMRVGEILSRWPETVKVFKKYYGEGCFSCPGQATESVKQSAMMHNIDERRILEELNRAAGARTQPL